jgi:hypothetical protein
MMTLNTLSEKRTDSEARVFWRTGTTKKGILDVKLDFEHEDAALIAELIAFWHFLDWQAAANLSLQPTHCRGRR